MLTFVTTATKQQRYAYHNNK